MQVAKTIDSFVLLLTIYTAFVQSINEYDNYRNTCNVYIHGCILTKGLDACFVHNS